MKFMSFNTRGLGSNVKRTVIKKLALKEEIDFLMLQETKITQFDNSIRRSVWLSDQFNEAHTDAQGRSGGLLAIWDSNKFSVSEESISRPNFILTTGSWVASVISCTFVNVYAPSGEAPIMGRDF